MRYGPDESLPELLVELTEALEALIDEAESWDWKSCTSPRGGDLGHIKPKYALEMIDAIHSAKAVLKKANDYV